DTEATIRATDTKASIALVVHGFIFVGLVGVLSRLGTGFEDACTSFRALIIILAALTGLVFLGSIIQLLRCVMPTPVRAVPDPPAHDVFYLGAAASKWTGISTPSSSFDELKDRVFALTDAEVDVELLAELFKVSAIRARKIALASSGFELLGAEVTLALFLLASLGIHYL
ncbi:MAG TPA: hypothetical protein VK575_07230, partial [Gemmatimonadaceae bacterium]|nr:hypothetical protein [Gemmatimonadaceae bacterium]